MQIDLRKRKLKESNSREDLPSTESKIQCNSINSSGHLEEDNLSFNVLTASDRRASCFDSDSNIIHDDEESRYHEKIIAQGCCLPWKLVFVPPKKEHQKRKNKPTKHKNREQRLGDQNHSEVNDERRKTIVNLDLVSLERMNKEYKENEERMGTQKKIEKLLAPQNLRTMPKTIDNRIMNTNDVNDINDVNEEYNDGACLNSHYTIAKGSGDTNNNVTENETRDKSVCPQPDNKEDQRDQNLGMTDFENLSKVLPAERNPSLRLQKKIDHSTLRMYGSLSSFLMDEGDYTGRNFTSSSPVEDNNDVHDDYRMFHCFKSLPSYSLKQEPITNSLDLYYAILKYRQNKEGIEKIQLKGLDSHGDLEIKSDTDTTSHLTYNSHLGSVTDTLRTNLQSSPTEIIQYELSSKQIETATNSSINLIAKNSKDNSNYKETGKYLYGPLPPPSLVSPPPRIPSYIQDMLASGIVRLCISVESFNFIDEKCFKFLLRLLPESDQKRITRFINVKDQHLSLASAFIQRALIAWTFGIAYNEILIERTPIGKPYFPFGKYLSSTTGKEKDNHVHGYLERFPCWNYNVSHHGQYVGIATEPLCLVGLDIMNTEDRPRGFKKTNNRVLQRRKSREYFDTFKRQMSRNEWDMILEEKNEDEQYARFYRQWALKESYVKALGTGLTFSPRRIEMRHSIGHADSISSLEELLQESSEICEEKTIFVDEHIEKNSLTNYNESSDLENHNTNSEVGNNRLFRGSMQRSKSSPSILETFSPADETGRKSSFWNEERHEVTGETSMNKVNKKNFSGQSFKENKLDGSQSTSNTKRSSSGNEDKDLGNIELGETANFNIGNDNRLIRRHSFHRRNSLSCDCLDKMNQKNLKRLVTYDDIDLRIDGMTKNEWKFKFFNLDMQHVACVCRGPHYMSKDDSLYRQANFLLTREEIYKALEAPQPNFVEITLLDLVPENHLKEFEALYENAWSIFNEEN